MNEIKPTPTPGPWEIDERFPGSYAIEPNVAWLGASSSHQNGENLANARLIAAAPELLEALEEMARFCQTGDYDGRDPLDMAFEAIAKAKGDTPS
jgi:hypothetical protein